LATPNFGLLSIGGGKDTRPNLERREVGENDCRRKKGGGGGERLRLREGGVFGLERMLEGGCKKVW